MPIRKITNYLNFFNSIVGLWKTIKSERESILRGFFMNQKRLTHKQYDEITSMFNGPPKFYRMYGDEILSEYGSYTWDDDFYYLRLKAPLPLDSANIMAYSKDILKTNLQRILGKTINGSAELRIGTFGKFPLKIAPRDMMAAALLSFYCEEVIPNKTNMQCKCGCGENVSNGSEFFNRKHYLQWYKENTPNGIKEKALSKYRTRLNNGRITSGQYNDIKIYADKVLKQIKNKDIEQIKELFPQKIDSYWAKINTPTSTPTHFG